MKALATLLVLAALMSPVHASDPTVVQASWAPNEEQDLAGYRFYLVNRKDPLDVYRVGQVDCSCDEGLSTTALQLNVPGGGIYILTMTAFDEADNESGRSKAAVSDRTRRVVYFKNPGAPKIPSVQPMTVSMEW